LVFAIQLKQKEVVDKKEQNTASVVGSIKKVASDNESVNLGTPY
jgi:hypothetical protein